MWSSLICAAMPAKSPAFYFSLILAVVPSKPASSQMNGIEGAAVEAQTGPHHFPFDGAFLVVVPDDRHDGTIAATSDGERPDLSAPSAIIGLP